MSVDKRKLQKLIDACVSAGGPWCKATANLNDYCIEAYGFEPADIDADGIIDAVLGGSGPPNGMTAEEFNDEMLGGKP